MKSVFISASIQDPSVTAREGLAPICRHDIREALVTCADVLGNHYELIWGGHPAITALLAPILDDLRSEESPPVYRIFQSDWFPRADGLLHVTYTPNEGSREASLTRMREDMLSPDIPYALGLFMGGKTEGLSEEIALFRKNHPEAFILALPRTGGYAAHFFANHFVTDKKEGLASHDPACIRIPLSWYTLCERGSYNRLFVSVFDACQTADT